MISPGFDGLADVVVRTMALVAYIFAAVVCIMVAVGSVYEYRQKK